MAIIQRRGAKRKRGQSGEEIRRQSLSMTQMLEFLAQQEYEGACRQEGLDEAENDSETENDMDSEVSQDDEDLALVADPQIVRDVLGLGNGGFDERFPIQPCQYEIRVLPKEEGCMRCRARCPPESIYYKANEHDFVHDQCAMRYALLTEVAKCLENGYQEWLQEPEKIFASTRHIAPKVIYELLHISSSQFSKVISCTCLSWRERSLPLGVLFAD